MSIHDTPGRILTGYNDPIKFQALQMLMDFRKTNPVMPIEKLLSDADLIQKFFRGIESSEDENE